MKQVKISSLRRPSRTDDAAVVGAVRLDRDTNLLARRLRPGDIAVIDHVDLDRISAEQLVACRVGAVVNAAESSSGRFPNFGPEIITAAGILLVDNVGADIFRAVKDGDKVRVVDGVVTRSDKQVASGAVLDRERVAELMTDARTGLSSQLESFAANTMEYLRREHELLLDGVGVPLVRTELRDRHVLVVVRGYDYKSDLKALRHYIGDYDPVLIGVDAGADALVQAGHTPDLIVADPSTVSDSALTCGAEVVVHVERGRTPSFDRLEKLQVDATAFAATGTSEDAAMLLADTNGASLVVAVGTHTTLVEFLDKGRSGMASNYLTRLKLGPKLVDASGVLQLYRSRIGTWQVLLLLFAGIVAVAVAVASTPVGSDWFDSLGSDLTVLSDWLQGLGR